MISIEGYYKGTGTVFDFNLSYHKNPLVEIRSIINSLCITCPFLIFVSKCLRFEINQNWTEF